MTSGFAGNREKLAQREQNIQKLKMLMQGSTNAMSGGNRGMKRAVR
ncbi:MAG: hypothetical protein IJI45_19955 [Anaerolineaceae bacterium]|nr:hypothetical protein [Anaerolineaceae bacterium]